MSSEQTTIGAVKLIVNNYMKEIADKEFHFTKDTAKYIASKIVLFGLGVSFGILYAWNINPIEYVGANILDMPSTTHLPTVLGLLRLVDSVKDDPYSLSLVANVFTDLGVNKAMMCETRSYLSFLDEINRALIALGVVC